MTIGNLIQTAIDRALEHYQPVLQLVRDTLPARALPPEGQDGSGGYPASPHDHDDRYYTKPQTDAEITEAIATHEGAVNPHAQYLLLSSVSLTATPNFVPRAGVAGKLATGWIPAILLDSMVSGTLPIANGGTGATTAVAALVALGGVRNAGSVVSFQAGLDLGKGSAGTAGRVYLATDTLRIYRDTGTQWVVIGSVQLTDQLGELSDPQHGSRGGGTLHAVATISVNGFLSAADKAKLDGVAAGAQVASVSATAPLASSGGTTPTISLQSQAANVVLAGPATGAASAPAFRVLVAADIPPLDASKISSGTIPIVNGGTGQSSASAALTALGGVRNAGNVSSIQAGLDSAKPSAATPGQLYVSTDTQQVYRSTNMGWQLVASVRLADQLGEVSDAQHGTRSGGTLHATATPSVAGFMSAADKSKLDSVGANIAYLNAAQTWTAAQTFNAGATLPLGQDLRANGATRGVMERLIDVRGLNFADEHFRTGVATAGYTWRGPPFTVPLTVDYAANGDYLVVTPANGGRHFFAKTISTFANRSLTIRAAPQHNALVGLRVDDGTDNNYYQAVLRFAGAGQMRFEMHQRTSGGTVTVQLGPTTMLGALLVFQLLSFQPAATHTPFMYIVNEVGFSSIMISGIGVSWAAQRAGIVVQEGESGTGFSFVDWLKNEHT